LGSERGGSIDEPASRKVGTARLLWVASIIRAVADIMARHSSREKTRNGELADSSLIRSENIRATYFHAVSLYPEIEVQGINVDHSGPIRRTGFGQRPTAHLYLHVSNYESIRYKMLVQTPVQSRGVGKQLEPGHSEV
jgi:hypothetical protein